MEIRRNITNTNRTIYNHKRPIEFLVMHYFGAFGTARKNTNYFKDVYREASAHYFVDEKEIWQCVEDKDIAWHCGDDRDKDGPFKGICTNFNSLSIEMRPNKINKHRIYASDKDWYFEQEVIDNSIKLARYLIDKYDIPYDHVIRHHDVTGKYCPRPFMGDDINKYYNTTGNIMWNNFKLDVRGEDEVTQEQFNEMMEVYLKQRKEKKPSKDWGVEEKEWAEFHKIIIGDTKGNLQYKSFVTREQNVIFLKRIYDLILKEINSKNMRSGGR